VKVFTLNLRPALIAIMSLLVPLASISFLVLSSMGELRLLSEKDLVAHYHLIDPGAYRPIYYLNYLPVSATFYSRGQAAKLSGIQTQAPAQGYWLAVHRTEGNVAGRDCTLQFQPRRGLFDLYLCKS